MEDNREPITLTDSEVEALNNIVTGKDRIKNRLGEIELLIVDLKSEKELLIESIKKIRQQENTVVETLTAKYGKGVIDLNKKTFVSSEGS